MALKITKVEVWSGLIDDRPGAGDQVLMALADAGANLEAVIGRRAPEHAGKGAIYVTPVKGRKVVNAAKAAGLKVEDVATLRVESANKAGMGHKIMAAIADAGVNVRGVSMIGSGNKAVAYIGFATAADAAAALKVMKKIK